MRTLTNARRRLPALILAVAVACLIGACGDDEETGNGTGDSTPAAGAERSASLKEDFEKWSTPPESIPVSEPHSKPAPKDLSIAYITCGLPTCTTISNSVKAAAETLGWKFTALGTEPTPEAVKEAWRQAVRLKPDAVFASGFPRAVFEPELQQLKKMGVGVFECCAPDEAENGITMSVVTARR